MKELSRAQRIVLRHLCRNGWRGYCELQQETGLSSYNAVGWVLDALERRNLIVQGRDVSYEVTSEGFAAGGYRDVAA